MTDMHDLRMEQGVLGYLLYENEALFDLRVTAADFYDPVHARIFGVIETMIRSGRRADPISVRGFFKESDGLGQIGGAQYLLTLQDSAARFSGHAREYAKQIRDYAQRRRIHAAVKEIEARCGQEPDATALLMDAERLLAEIAQEDRTSEEWIDYAAAADEAIARAESGLAGGISTGIPALDDCTGGIRPGTLWIVGGASSMGKSVVGQQLAQNIARQGHGVGYVHLEMDTTAIGLRAASSAAWDMRSGANPHYLSALRRKLTGAQWEQLRGATATLRNLPLKLDVRSGQTMTQIEARARRLVRAFAKQGIKPGALVIDHEGLIVSERQRESKPAEAGDRAVRLLALAKALDVGVIALAQLNRDGSRKDGESQLPEMTDLAWSAELERCAEVVVLLHRKAYYAERKPESARTDEDYEAIKSREGLLVVAKSRAGMRAHVPVIIDVRSAVMAPDGGAQR